MRVRESLSQDLPDIERIYNESRPQEFYAEEGQFSPVHWSKDKVIQAKLKKATIYVCEETEILGFCGFTGNHINWLFVSPEHRNKGVASALLTRILPEVGLGVTLTILASNKSACNLYFKFGFVEESEFSVKYQEQELTVKKLISTVSDRQRF